MSQPATPRKVILRTKLSPGDLCTLTAAIESLHQTYPGQFLTDIRTCCDELFTHNPNVTKLCDDEAESIELHYTDLINRSDSVPQSFLRGYCDDLGKKLGVALELATNRPHLYLSEDERAINPVANYTPTGPAKFWVLTAGIKHDFTLKQWPVEYYQQVVDHLRGRIQFVQIGAIEHDHPALDGVINLVGQTTTRELLRLVYHAQGGLGPITFLQHLCAAFEKPYMALLGGREPVIWTQYPLQTTFHTLGKLPCCRTKACWRSRVVKLHDGSHRDQSLCDVPVLSFRRPVGKCMAMIKPADVTAAIEMCLETDAKPHLPQPVALAQPPQQSDSTKDLDLVAHSAWGFDVPIIPAKTPRDWMDQTDRSFAYHCLPMVTANQSGWFVLASHGAVIEWNGGSAKEDLKVEILDNPKTAQAVSSVGSGIVTWLIPYVFRTTHGWNLLCRGPANCVKDGIAPLEGLVETDWSTASFSMNWKLTRPGRVEFAQRDPIAMLVPQRRFELEAFRPRFVRLNENLALRDGYAAWIRSRQQFLEARSRQQSDSSRPRFERHYLKGLTVTGQHFPGHQTTRKLMPFARAQ